MPRFPSTAAFGGRRSRVAANHHCRLRPRRNAPLRAGVLLIALSLAAGAVRAENVVEAGRRILKTHADAVISVKMVVHISLGFGGRDQENESTMEAVGVIVDPSGLTLISLATIDPSAMIRGQMRGRAPAEFKVDSRVKDAKIVLADGTELAAQIVLRDKDLDMAFLRPTDKPAQPLPYINLAQAGQPQVLDNVICLNRLGKIVNRVVAVSIERIDALVERPRPFYILSPGGSSGVGSPVFGVDGRPLGVVLMRSSTTEVDFNPTSIFSGATGSYGFLPVVVPAADIVEVAKQALEARAPAAE